MMYRYLSAIWQVNELAMLTRSCILRGVSCLAFKMEISFSWPILICIEFTHPYLIFKPLWGQCSSYENMFSERIFIIGSSQCIKTKLFAMLFPIYSKIPLVIPFIMALDLTQWGYVWFYRPFSCNWFLCSKSAGFFFRNIGHSPFSARYFSRKKGDIVDMCAKNKKRRIHAPNISINM